MKRMEKDDNGSEILPSEKAEYFEYHNYDDILNNLISACLEIDKYKFLTKNDILVCGAMIAFDRGLSNWLNLLSRNNRLILLSEVTAQYKRYTAAKINFPSICTSHLLAKEIYVNGIEIPVSDEIKRFVKKNSIVLETAILFQGQHRNIGKGYSLVWAYYSYLYIDKMLKTIKPKKVILWNKYYPFHYLIDFICKQKHIDVLYMEFGCLPGTISLEKKGQNGESKIASKKCHLLLYKANHDDVKLAKDVINYLRIKGLNRNPQPLNKVDVNNFVYYISGRRNVLYTGQNDWESGMYPSASKRKKYHSPVFSSTLEALDFLRLLSIKNKWNLIFKPHPLVDYSDAKINEYTFVSIVENYDINDLIDISDVIVTIFSQCSYIGLIREKPVVMLGYNQLRGKKCTYEAFHISTIEKKIKDALVLGYTEEQKEAFERHVSYLLKNNLYDDYVDRDIRFGLGINSIKI